MNETSWARSRAPTLVMARTAWVLTVNGDTEMRAAISSSVIGLSFFMNAAGTEVSLGGPNGYAVGGAILYLVSAFRLYRSARTENVPA